jgi:hypothetical protein
MEERVLMSIGHMAVHRQSGMDQTRGADNYCG